MITAPILGGPLYPHLSIPEVKMEVTSKPAELERLDRKILQPLGFFLRHLLLVDPFGGARDF